MLKIVYFDEEAANDMNILDSGGKLNFKTKQNILENKEKKMITIKKIDIITLLFCFLYFLVIYFETKNITISSLSLVTFPLLKKIMTSLQDSLNLSNNTENILHIEKTSSEESEIFNTTLTDFLKKISETTMISKFNNIKLELEPDSLSFLKSYSSIFRILKPEAFEEEIFKPLNLANMEDFLNSCKGYYEVIAIDKNNEEIESIFRFNLESFKNKYQLSDLLKMNLIFYGILVGEMRKEELDISKMFDNEKKEITLEDIQYNSFDNENSLKIFDIILAGVEIK